MRLLVGHSRLPGSVATPGDLARCNGRHEPTMVADYPMEPAARAALKTVVDALPRLSSVKRIHFVLFDAKGLRIHTEVLDELTAQPLGG